MPTHADAPAAKEATPPHAALHNLFNPSPGIYSGSVPDSSGAFEELKHLGVKTIISVDGSTPDVAAATAHGMRYVHIPTQYSGISEEESRTIARAIRDLPGPVYIHCHHGKHRGPAATAAALVHLGRMTPEQGGAFMKNAGTAPSYPGLYECVAMAVVLSKGELDAAPSEFPATAKVTDLAHGMVIIDQAFENLKLIKDAGWATPKDHPDLVPAAEAGRLADQFRVLHEQQPADQRDPATFAKFFMESRMHADALERSLVGAGALAKERDGQFAGLGQSCKACHAKFRDK